MERKNRCYSVGAKKFENNLNELGISYNQFMELQKRYLDLLMSEKAELADCLKDYNSNKEEA